MKQAICFLFLLLIASGLYSQEVNISYLLQAVDNGKIETAQEGLKKLKKSNPNDPSVIYLDALLTSDGKEAIFKYEKIVEKYPRSHYADASLFRIYSYYYAQGLYNTAQKYYNRLEKNYPSSAYLKPPAEIEEVPVNTDNKEVPERIPESHKEKSEPEKVYKYTIQMGAFLVQGNANKLKETFEKAGYVSEVKDKKVGGSTFSIVYLGRFETEDEAKIFLSDLNKRQKIEGRVVHIE